MNKLLAERELTHGKFSEVAEAYCEITRACSLGSYSHVERMAIEMISMKMARISSGNASYIDHWRDISGYAELVVRELEK